MPGFKEFYDESRKMFPIFFNFFGQTQLTMALNANDNQSFYLLLSIFIEMQGCLESSFLVKSWFIKAFREGLEIMPLLESQIIRTQLSNAIVEHWDTWPQLHVNV